MNSKQIVAVATLALSGAAMAQSSVTVYGRLDASIGSAKAGPVTAGVGPTRVTQMFSNNFTTSRVGFRGTEDLGSGLSALFIIETSLSPDAPAATSLGNRAAVVGLSGGFGTVKLGRHDTSFDDIRDLMVSSNLWDSGHLASTETILGADANSAVPGVAGVGQLADYGDRANNQIRYESPSFNGFTFGASHGFGEDVKPAKSDRTAFNLRYKVGGLDVGYGYQENKSVTAALVDSSIEYNTLAAAYNFGAFRISGGWNQAKQDKVASPAKSDTYSIGVNVPVDALDFSLGYSTAKAKTTLTGATAEKGSAFSAGMTYALSKRTKAYAAITSGDIKDAAGTELRQRDIYAIGLIHTF
ncbi:MAG: porin [Hydrogenophaga sp.]|nr:porin [Hydrogenophaga sp.]